VITDAVLSIYACGTVPHDQEVEMTSSSLICTVSMLPATLQKELEKLEPGSTFSGQPRVESSSGKVYYAKAGSASEKEQYVAETESLKAINGAAPGLAPTLLSFGYDEADRPFFISEYKDLSRLDHSAGGKLAKRMATELHQCTNPEGKFGFHVPTFCGATRQKNGWYNSWEECFNAMIGDLFEIIKRKGSSYHSLCETGQRLQSK
jgi:protein-ribulosamine 3-kinase